MEQSSVDQENLDKVDHGKRRSAEERDAEFFPEDLKNIRELDIIQRESTDDRDGSLAAAVARRIHQHGDKAGQGDAGCEGIFKIIDDDTCKCGADHEEHQPRDTGFPGLEDAGLEVGFICREDSCHLFDILCCLVFHDIDDIVDRDDTDETVFLVGDGQRDEVVSVEEFSDLFLVIRRRTFDDIIIHDVRDTCLIGMHQEILDRYDAFQMAFVVRDEKNVDRLGILPVCADIIECVEYAHFLFQGQVLRRHNRAGGIFRVFEELIDELSGLRRRVL